METAATKKQEGEKSGRRGAQKRFKLLQPAQNDQSAPAWDATWFPRLGVRADTSEKKLLQLKSTFNLHKVERTQKRAEASGGTIRRTEENRAKVLAGLGLALGLAS